MLPDAIGIARVTGQSPEEPEARCHTLDLEKRMIPILELETRLRPGVAVSFKCPRLCYKHFDGWWSMPNRSRNKKAAESVCSSEPGADFTGLACVRRLFTTSEGSGSMRSAARIRSPSESAEFRKSRDAAQCWEQIAWEALVREPAPSESQPMPPGTGLHTNHHGDRYPTSP